eukprot:GHVR01124300.1.p1 GENE.GHVR01124300.1~~GHVR01124300.1.p1  ORF type:complete len:378 (+),score=75.89 GHVR01124300.1:63-1196(+)
MGAIKTKISIGLTCLSVVLWIAAMIMPNWCRAIMGIVLTVTISLFHVNIHVVGLRLLTAALVGISPGASSEAAELIQSIQGDHGIDALQRRVCGAAIVPIFDGLCSSLQLLYVASLTTVLFKIISFSLCIAAQGCALYFMFGGKKKGIFKKKYKQLGCWMLLAALVLDILCIIIFFMCSLGLGDAFGGFLTDNSLLHVSWAWMVAVIATCFSVPSVILAFTNKVSSRYIKDNVSDDESSDDDEKRRGKEKEEKQKKQKGKPKKKDVHEGYSDLSTSSNPPHPHPHPQYPPPPQQYSGHPPQHPYGPPQPQQYGGGGGGYVPPPMMSPPTYGQPYALTPPPQGYGTTPPQPYGPQYGGGPVVAPQEYPTANYTDQNYY